ncbi:MAG: M56 family metallopeptidase, partial [Lacipirellulaceae bacterium]
MNALLNTHGWHIAGWTMLHFLWIGTAIALLGMLMHYFAGRQRQGLRYMTALVTLVVFAVAPVGIAWHLSNHLPPKSEVTNVEPQPSAPLPPAAVLPLTIEDEQPDEPLVIDLAEMPLEETHLDRIDTELGNLPTITHSQPAFPTDQQPAPSASRATTTLLAPRLSSLASHLPWVWLVGAPLTFALLTTGIVGSEKLRRTTQSASDQIKEIADRLAATLPISRNVAVAVSDRIAQPILIGIVRPMILLPSSALTGWTPEELEMVLLHELSHVRRWDNLVNLAQRLIESLLFFHPCVWWISRQVRIDREECVDAAVVGRTAKPQAYAELLVNFAAARNQLPRNLAASAMARHTLAGRIRRILNLEDEPMLVKRSTATLAGFAVLVVLSLLIWQPAPESIAQETKQEEVVEVKDSTTEEASELSHEGEAVVEESSTLGETAGSETNSVEEIVKSI